MPGAAQTLPIFYFIPPPNTADFLFFSAPHTLPIFGFTSSKKTAEFWILRNPKHCRILFYIPPNSLPNSIAEATPPKWTRI